MRHLLLLCVLSLGQDDGQVDRIMLRFTQRRERVQSQAEFLRLLGDTRAELEGYLKDHPDAPSAGRASFHVAETYLWAGDYSMGLEKLKALRKSYPDSGDAPTAAFLIGQILARNEDGEGARKAFQEFIESYPKDDRVLLAKSLIAVTLQNEKKYDEAARILLEVRQSYKDRKESWAAELQRSVVYHLQEKNEEAVRILEDVIRSCPDRSQVEAARNLKSKFETIGREAPSFNVRDLAGVPVSLETHRGKVVVLYFFDSAAPAAVTEFQFLKRARDAYGGKPLSVVGVSINLNRQDLLNFRDLQKVSWPILFDGRGLEGNLARSYDVRGLPALWVIGKKGKIRFFNVAGRDLENVVGKLLSEDP